MRFYMKISLIFILVLRPSRLRGFNKESIEQLSVWVKRGMRITDGTWLTWYKVVSVIQTRNDSHPLSFYLQNMPSSIIQLLSDIHNLCKEISMPALDFLNKIKQQWQQNLKWSDMFSIDILSNILYPVPLNQQYFIMSLN